MYVRCKACNAVLTETEMKRKDRETGEYLDLCGTCLSASNDAIADFYDLPTTGYFETEEWE